MELEEILERLKALGNEKVFEHNKKLGAHAHQFGVKLGDIRQLAKKIKTNHQLGLKLWSTGNIDAQLLSTLIMVPHQLSIAEMNHLVGSVNFVQVADWLNAYVVKLHPDKEILRQQWMESTNNMQARAGWSLTAGRVSRDADGLDLDGLLYRIETQMPTAAPEVQWTMNTTLAQIGINHPAYRSRAIAIGEQLGIYRNYPVSKGCTSPFAPIWINEMVCRNEKEITEAKE